MATLKDIAERAGVSASAVSRILNHDDTLSVPVKTRQRVFDAAKKLGYRKVRNVIRSSFTVGIVQWFSLEEELQDNYYLLIRQGIEDFCMKNSIVIRRAFRTDQGDMDDLKKVDGLICIGKFSEKEILYFRQICRNVLFLDMEVPDPQIPTITLNFGQAANIALDYLYGLGHRKIAFIGGKEYTQDGKPVKDERKRIYESYMKKKKLYCQDYMQEGTYSAATGYEKMKKLLDSEEVPTAVFAASDNIAFGVIRAIKESGKKVPEDISVIGFDDIEMSEWSTPALTTVHAPAYDMGQYGANYIFTASNIQVSTALKMKLPCSLIERESCRNV